MCTLNGVSGLTAISGGSIALNSATGSLGGGVGVVYLANAGTQPSSAPTGGPIICGNSGNFAVYDTAGHSVQLSGSVLTFASSTTAAPVLSQTTPTTDAAASPFAVTAQSAYLSATVNINGGALNLNGGASAGGAITAAGGSINLNPGASTASTSGTGGSVNLNFQLPVGTGSEQALVINRNSVQMLAWSYTGQVVGIASTLNVTQTQAATAQTPLNMTIQPQAPNAGSTTTVSNTPGSLIVNLSARGTNTANGNYPSTQIQYAATTFCYVQPCTTGTYGAVYLGLLTGVTPSGTNYSLLGGANLQINGSSGCNFQAAGNNICLNTAAGFQVGSAAAFAGASGNAVGIANVTTAPTTAVSTGGVLYSASQALKWWTGATSAYAPTTLAPAPSAGTVNSQTQLRDRLNGTCETVSSATPTAIATYTTVSGIGGCMFVTLTSRATTIGTGITVGATGFSLTAVSYQNIAGTVTVTAIGTPMSSGTSQTALTAPVLTASASGNVITLKVTNQALCTTDSTCFAEIYAS